MDSRSTGNVQSNDNNILFGQCSSHRERRELIKFEEIKVEPYHAEPSSLEPSGEQKTSVKMDSKSKRNVETNVDNILLGQCSSYKERSDLIKFEEIKVEPYHPEPSYPPLESIMKKEAEMLMQNDKPTMPLTTSRKQRTSVEMDSRSTGIVVSNDNNILLGHCSSYHERSDLIKFEEIKVEPYHPEPSCPSLKTIIKEEAEVSMQNDKSSITLSTSGKRRTSVKLEMKIEADDFGIWEHEPEEFNRRKTGSAVLRKSTDQREMQNGIGKTCKTYADLPYHSMLQPTVELYRLHECGICRKAFTQKSIINQHMLIHTQEKLHECNVCGKAFTKKSTMKTHMMIHTEVKAHECNICGKAFRHLISMNNHTMIHTGEKPHECNVCGKAFTRKSDMKHHTMTHTGEKPHRCSVCEKGFIKKSTMNHHMSIHTGEKPHKCVVCGKAFIQRTRMNHHMLIHSGEKPYKCDVCEKGFAQKSQIRKHVMIHTGEKLHECDVCGKAFIRRCDMNHHIIIHSGEMPHECIVCRKTFKRKRDMKRHTISHTGEKTHRCSVCGKGFTRKLTLKHHMVIHSSEMSAK